MVLQRAMQCLKLQRSIASVANGATVRADTVVGQFSVSGGPILCQWWAT